MRRTEIPFIFSASAFTYADAFLPIRSSLSQISATHKNDHSARFSSPSHVMGALSFSSILTSDESIPEYQTANAFQDDVNLADLISDPFLQISLLLTVLAIAALFIAKSIVTQMDDAVQKTALDFDRVMKKKYAKKWEDFINEEEELVGIIDREEKEGDRIQRVVEEMERLTKEEPEFFARVMRDVDKQI